MGEGARATVIHKGTCLERGLSVAGAERCGRRVVGGGGGGGRDGGGGAGARRRMGWCRETLDRDVFYEIRHVDTDYGK